MNLGSEIPREKTLDSSLSLLLEGYQFISNRCKKYQTNIFQTRLLGQHAICVSGEEYAEMFYDQNLFQRKGATPQRIQKSLFGQHGVQTLDGAQHKHRKSLFMSLMTSKNIRDIAEITYDQWEAAIVRWEFMDQVILFNEVEKIMCRVACEWAGVPLWARELELRTNDLSALINAFGAVGMRHWHGRWARKRAENWIRGMIKDVRNNKISAVEGKALYAMSWHRNLDGSLMNTQMAAIELINILRPIVAIARYITFGALALHHYPEVKQKLEQDHEDYKLMFVQEIRRFFPFGPFLGARVRKDFQWKYIHFIKGTLVLLDIYGTNHDPTIWDNPDEFNPERFKNWDGNPFNFIPQGGGEFTVGHRCAGEWITVEIMKKSLDVLVSKINYEVPSQDLNVSLIRMPSIPKSGFIIANVKAK